MKRSTAMILAALVLSTAALSGCAQSGNNNAASAPSDTSTAASSQGSSAAESTESEISDTESSVVSEAASAESSEENSKTSKAESSDNKSKTESSKTKTEEKSKSESSKPETSKTETSKTETSKTEEVKATGISIDLSTLSLTAGYGYELNAYILWSNNTSSYQGITWSSNNSSVASVNSTGYVTAKSAGTATITASYGSYSKSCTVTVKAAQQTQPSPPSGGGNSGNGGSNNGGSSNSTSVVLKYNYDNLYEVEVGDTLSVKPNVIENGTLLAGAGDEKYKISYKSSNTAVATVSSDGYVKGISEGSATITATYGSSSVSVTVSVLKASGSSGSVYQGGKIVKGNWGWTQYDEQIGFWVVDAMYKDQWGNEYHAKTLEKDHAKDKVITRNGKYTCYLCPEIVPAFNAYLKEQGYNYEFKWYCDLEDGHRDVTYCKNKNGNSMTQGCIDNYEMECKTQIMSHETEYSCGGAQIIGDMCQGYDFYGLIKCMHEEAPSHWNALLKAAQKRGTITAVLAPCKPNDLSSGFMVYIST